MIFEDYKVITYRPGGIKVVRISDGKKLLHIVDNYKIKFFNNGEDVLSIKKTEYQLDRSLTGMTKDVEGHVEGTIKEITEILKNPFKKNEIIYTVKQTNISIATSGDYERFFEIDSLKYSHILNPKTCKPIKGITSVTVFAYNPTFADALATSISVMGVDVGLDLINQIDGVEAVFILSDGTVFLSDQLKSK